MGEAVAPPGLLGNAGGNAAFDGLHCQQLASGVVAGGIQAGHIEARQLGQLPQPLGPPQPLAGHGPIKEGRQQLLAVTEQQHIKEGGQRFGISGEHRAAAKHQRVLVAPFAGPERNPLLFEQIQQHRPIQLPAQREAKQVEVWPAAALAPVGRIPLVGE